MKRLIPTLLLCLVTIPIVAALVIGLFWLRAALPHAPAVTETPALKPPDNAPRQASIPWQRNPDALPRIAAGPAWYPWEKMPRVSRQTNAWGPPPPTLPRVPISAAEITQVTKALAAPNPADALARIDRFIRINPVVVSEQLRRINAPWASALFAAKRFDTFDQLTGQLLAPVAYNTAVLEALLNVRTRSAMEQNRPDVAFERAREWFAIATLYNTSGAIRVAEDALAAQHAAASKAARRAFQASFNEAAAPATSEPAGTLLRLDPQSADAAKFLAAARQLDAEDYGSLTARGNLYLLAGRPDLARHVFRRAYMLAAEAQLPAAVENFARCLKADSGTIAAANAFILEPH